MDPELCVLPADDEGWILDRLAAQALPYQEAVMRLAEVNGFDLEARHVTAMQPGGRNVNLPFDSLIVAAGAGQSYFGHDEYSEWAPGILCVYAPSTC